MSYYSRAAAVWIWMVSDCLELGCMPPPLGRTDLRRHAILQQAASVASNGFSPMARQHPEHSAGAECTRTPIIPSSLCLFAHPPTHLHTSIAACSYILYVVPLKPPPAGALSGGGRLSKSWMIPGPAGLFFKGPWTPSVNPPPPPPVTACSSR